MSAMKFRQIDLNLLVVLDLLLREQSVSRSAARLGLTQAAVSVHLARLRDHFQDDLLRQVGRQLELTDFARELVPQVARLLSRTNILLAKRPHFEPKTCSKVFRFATADIEAVLLLSEVNRRLAAIAPNILVQTKEMHPGVRLESRSVENFINRGKNDFVIIPKGTHSLRHGFDTLYAQDYVCLVSKDNPFVGDVLQERQYLEMRHVVRMFGEEDCQTFDANHFQSIGVERKIGAIVDTYSLIPEMLVGTPYVATVPERFARRAAARYPLRVLRCPVQLPKCQSVLQWQQHLHFDPAALWLRTILLEIAGQEL